MAWHHFYEFWVGQQTLPGNILGDILIGAATFIIGKYKVAPWLHKRHKEQLDQRERQHREVMQAHQRLFDLHQQQHDELCRHIAGQPVVPKAAGTGTNTGAQDATSAEPAAEPAAPAPVSTASAPVPVPAPVPAETPAGTPPPDHRV